MSKIYLIEGPVGSGKSTLASKLSNEFSAPRLILDKWMTILFSPDRPDSDFIGWYLERKDRCIEQIWDVLKNPARKQEMVEKNYRLATRSFSYEVLGEKLTHLLELFVERPAFC